MCFLYSRSSSNFNPRSPCGERRYLRISLKGLLLISIHALRVESDALKIFSGDVPANFNPRSPCGERHIEPVYLLTFPLFQSTLSVWRATSLQIFYKVPYLFQSTLSVWRATYIRHFLFIFSKISIHALRVESDILSPFIF